MRARRSPLTFTHLTSSHRISISQLSRILHNLMVTYLLSEAHSGYDLPFQSHRLFPAIFGGAPRHEEHHQSANVCFHQFFKYLDDGFGAGPRAAPPLAGTPLRWSADDAAHAVRVARGGGRTAHHADVAEAAADAAALLAADGSPAAGAEAVGAAAGRHVQQASLAEIITGRRTRPLAARREAAVAEKAA
jgi:hypothetical protein